MLTVMSFVSIAVMVILCMRLRKHREVYEFEGVLKQMHVNTDVFNDKTRG